MDVELNIRGMLRGFALGCMPHLLSGRPVSGPFGGYNTHWPGAHEFMGLEGTAEITSDYTQARSLLDA